MNESDRDRWRRVAPLLDELLELSATERSKRLDEACADDPALRAEVEVLLRADAKQGGVLDVPGAGLAEAALRALTPDNQPQADDEGRLLPGVRVAGRYRIVSRLGRGGMGEVYRADDLKLGQAVALKFLPVDVQHRAGYLTRLLDEVKLARQISHPNVCRVYDIGESDGRHFLSMEYVDGEDLASLLNRIGPLPSQKALDTARQLCAGLHAAHRLGILHRDLKPANVMLDGRGQIRITDFGLAIPAAEVEGRQVFAGTPAYMAPEQFEHGEATRRTDIYALGLVLYEVFTGPRPFEATSIAELRRLHEESTPVPTPASGEVDPAIERAILQCLEEDPALRPESAADVAAMLPGGDSLSAALAAGETPSPELVAALGPARALRARTALGMLGVIASVMIALLLLCDRSSTLGSITALRSADALDDNARGILARLGHDRVLRDRTHLFAYSSAWRRFVYHHDGSHTRWDALRQPGQFALSYFYRQAPYPLVPRGRNGWVNVDDPPPQAGDAQLFTDLRGKLLYLLIVPDDAEPPAEVMRNPDWTALFREAGLDDAVFHPVAPTRNPRVATDLRAAWSGTLANFGNYPVRVEAAMHRGKPVYFELVVPWDPYWDPAGVRPSVVSSINVVYVTILLFLATITGVLTVRNWLSGRGDRRGAFVIASAVFVLRFTAWVLGGHHVPVVDELVLALIAAGKALTDAAITWCVYVALEPYGRRLHPHLLVSWTRLLRGRVRDPLVGRDVLGGVATATVVILFWSELSVVLPRVLSAAAPPAPRPYPPGAAPFVYWLDTPPVVTLLGGRFVLQAIPAVVLHAFASMLLWTMLLLALQLLLRKRWAAVVIGTIVTGVLAWPSTQSNFDPVAVACTLAGATALVWAVRFGLLGLLTIWTCVYVYQLFPLTARPAAPYFGTGLVGVLVIAALALYGAAISTARSGTPARA